MADRGRAKKACFPIASSSRGRAIRQDCNGRAVRRLGVGLIGRVHSESRALRSGSPRRPHVPAGLAAERRRRGGGPRRHPRAPGNGVRLARRSPGGDRSLHDHRMPRRLRGLRAITSPGARTRLVRVAVDLRRDHTLDRHRRSGQRDRARRHAGTARRPDRDRARGRQARLRRRSSLERGAGRLHERARRHDRGGAASEALRLLDRRGFVRRRDPRVRRPSR